jgi:hypothetical protein
VAPDQAQALCWLPGVPIARQWVDGLSRALAALLVAALPVGLCSYSPLAGAASVAQLAASDDDRSGPAGGAVALAGVASADLVDVGRRIYHEGLGAQGQPVIGLRFGGVESRGAAVACVNCHRRSGLGAVEGTDQVAPIAGRFIFTDDARAVVSMNLRTNRAFNQRHAAFDDATFAAAVTRGQHVDGRALSPIMPRFELTEAELSALQAYLRTLSAQWSPGVGARRLRFATVVTPDVAPARRAVFLETVRAAVAQKNGNYTPGMRTMSSAAEMLFRSDRHWDLDVWELTGAPATWAAQLDERQRAHPVFALVSGLGGGEWAPVHEFCERQAVPCWFPSVDAVPASAASDFYSIYFSAGVGLEADVLALHLAGEPGTAPGAAAPARLLQLHRGDAAGRAGAQGLQRALAVAAPDMQVQEVAVTPGDGAGLRTVLGSLGPRDAVMLWWPADALAELAGVEPPAAARVFVSARLATDQLTLVPVPWRATWHWVDLYQTPQQRLPALFYFHSWLKSRHIELRDEVLQSEVYFALSYLGETLTDMIDNVHRDYLIERAENMLSLREGQKSEDETRELVTAKFQKGPGGAQGAMARLASQPAVQRTLRPQPGQPAHTQAKREGTTVYPRLGLGVGQRFAAKAGRIVRVEASASSPPGKTLVPVSDWLVP